MTRILVTLYRHCCHTPLVAAGDTPDPPSLVENTAGCKFYRRAGELTSIAEQAFSTVQLSQRMVTKPAVLRSIGMSVHENTCGWRVFSSKLTTSSYQLTVAQPRVLQKYSHTPANSVYPVHDVTR
jgi:hypothetical protein